MLVVLYLILILVGIAIAAIFSIYNYLMIKHLIVQLKKDDDPDDPEEVEPKEETDSDDDTKVYKHSLVHLDHFKRVGRR